ncbi:CDF family Co(II)/Ni(II) efflux transporter DmeF [Caldimonas sp. KR1-144]|uniref:CDF family Co(II)/Ni(II) efflux transporter DmeF n=1 Tax=Caldimonas sp. KR1-144 TaxID=3400911 RepID=UPI003C10B3DC
MHTHDLSPWQHPHDFAPDRRASERRTWLVVAITGAMMVVEIAAGWWWNSMALLADGWHMGTHAVAIGVAGASYWLVRRWRADARFSLGPWKVEVLGAYSSALLLGVVAISVTVESIARLFRPAAISYDESLVVAVVGLAVNLACARLLHQGDHDQGRDHGHAHSHRHDHDHESDHDHHHGHAHSHADLNLKAAYLHVLADAATSVLAIGALVAGKWFGWVALDPLVGLLGAALIAVWARGLLAESATILLDREMDHPLASEVRARLEGDGDAQVCDLHLTRVGGERFAVHATVVADRPASADAYRERLRGLDGVAHASIEVNRCPHAAD